MLGLCSFTKLKLCKIVKDRKVCEVWKGSGETNFKASDHKNWLFRQRRGRDMKETENV
jgi:hypothetical protein